MPRNLVLFDLEWNIGYRPFKPQLAKLPPDTRAGAINQLTNTLTEIQTEAIKCL